MQENERKLGSRMGFLEQSRAGEIRDSGNIRVQGRVSGGVARDGQRRLDGPPVVGSLAVPARRGPLAPVPSGSLTHEVSGAWARTGLAEGRHGEGETRAGRAGPALDWAVAADSPPQRARFYLGRYYGRIAAILVWVDGEARPKQVCSFFFPVPRLIPGPDGRHQSVSHRWANHR